MFCITETSVEEDYFIVAARHYIYRVSEDGQRLKALSSIASYAFCIDYDYK